MFIRLLILEVFFVLYPILCAKEEAPYVFTSRKAYPNEKNPFTPAFHKWGLFSNFIIGLVAVSAYYPVWYNMLIVGLIAAYWYGALFDPVLNRLIGVDLWYEGDSADTDSWLRKTFPKKPGLVKTIVCLVLIVVANFLFYILNR